jgi:phosphatidylserine decarboxylase
MNEIRYIDRSTQKQEIEQVYGGEFLELMYGTGFLSKVSRLLLSPFVTKTTFLSHLYGFLQKTSLSQRKIKPFIEKFHVDSSEFLDSIDSFKSFNDFFIRKLKKEARPIYGADNIAILPADARYMFFQNIQNTDGFYVKGKKFSLKKLLQEDELAKRYENGSMVIARLCPTDYHRFHFPLSCYPSKTKLINGILSSVNPIALKRDINIFSENKRTMTKLESKDFGLVLFLEIGATCVAGINQTYSSEMFYEKGEEKGYFSFGGSSLIILFEPNVIEFDQDLLEASKNKIEIRGLMGQPMGRSRLI